MWRRSLVCMYPTNIPGIFELIGKEDGMGPRHLRSACTDHIIHTGDKRVPKRETIAYLFDRRLSAQRRGAGDGPRTHSREMGGMKHPPLVCIATCSRGSPYREVSSVKVTKAVDSLARENPAGPEGFPADRCINLPAPNGVLCILFSSVLNGGVPPSKITQFCSPSRINSAETRTWLLLRGL